MVQSVSRSIGSLLSQVKRDLYKVDTAYVYLLLPFLLIVSSAFFYYRLPWTIVFLVYGLVPKLDQYLRHDELNPTPQQVSALEHSHKFRAILLLFIVLDWTAFFIGVYAINTYEYSLMEAVPITFMYVNLAATVFLVSHELIHKFSPVDRMVGTLHLLKVLYMHFAIEHIHGHHKRVGTPEDSASAPKGMSLYEFVPKSIIGGYVSSFKLNPLFTIMSIVGNIAMLMTIYRLLGARAMLFFLVIALGAIFILELINYIEHYGLQRKKLPNGSYEKVTIRHSWNASHRISNYFLLKLQRHSDHHENSSKPYHLLCTYEDSPQLPHGYLVCLIIACYPKHWFAMMDPLVEEYSKSSKGTNLKALADAEVKANSFVNTLFVATLAMALVEILIKVL